MKLTGKRKIEDMKDLNLDDLLKTALKAAHAAGSAINDIWDKKSSVKDTKSNQRDLVTETDQRCEQIITEILKTAYPEHEIIGEETVGSGKYSLGSGPTWTVDPIDGTTNFVHRIPSTCVLIAFLLEKEPLVAVTYDPINDEMYWATKGGGAHLKSRRHDGPVAVSSCEALDCALVGLESGYGRDEKTVKRLSTTIEALMTKGVRSLRMAGACGLNVTNVACGRWDAFFEEGYWESNSGPKIWDFSPGKLIIEEAGGVMVNLDGSDFDLMGRGVFCAANRKLADEIIEMMKNRPL